MDEPCPRPRRWVLTGLLAAAVLLAAPAPGTAPAAAQEPAMERLRSAFPEEVARRIDEILQGAEAEGIPPALLMDKALEGAAKGASPQRVLETVTTLARELRTARVLVGPEADTEALAAAAEALRKGVDREAVRGLAEAHPGDLSMVLLVAGDLVQEGLAPGEARDVVDAAVEEGLAGDRLLTLPGALRRRIRAGAAPAEAASDVRRALQQGRPPGPF